MLRFSVCYATRGEDVRILPTRDQLEALSALVDAETMAQTRADLAALRNAEGVSVAEGELLFDAPTLPLKAVIDAEGWRRAAEAAEREQRAAKAEGREARFALSPELVNATVHLVRPEITYRGFEGECDAALSAWARVPDAVKEQAAAWLAPQYALAKDWADFLSAPAAG